MNEMHVRESHAERTGAANRAAGLQKFPTNGCSKAVAGNLRMFDSKKSVALRTVRHPCRIEPATWWRVLYINR